MRVQVGIEQIAILLQGAVVPSHRLAIIARHQKYGYVKSRTRPRFSIVGADESEMSFYPAIVS